CVVGANPTPKTCPHYANGRAALTRVVVYLGLHMGNFLLCNHLTFFLEDESWLSNLLLRKPLLSSNCTKRRSMTLSAALMLVQFAARISSRCPSRMTTI